jgi:hypothetical protein
VTKTCVTLFLHAQGFIATMAPRPSFGDVMMGLQLQLNLQVS